MGKSGNGSTNQSQANANHANHHANQCNPNNLAYTANGNNHANQCNPNHSSYQGSKR